MKIVSIVGARPQFIKVKPITEELKRRRGICHILVHTGQHYDEEMSRIFFEELNIPAPDYNLMVALDMPGAQIALMLERLEKVLLGEKPDMVMVYGDTNSTLAGALAAAKLGIRLAHVEAGLRSYKKDMPEEINRVVADHVSALLFCPTPASVKNLKKEGITRGVFLVGDVMRDVFLKSLPLLRKRKILPRLCLKPKGYFLLTVHRQENTDNLKNLISILSTLAKTQEKIVFPVHPRTAKTLKKMKSINLKNFLCIKPVSYLDMLALEKNARKILTDSGGVQKEAYWLGVPCVTLREETEWTDTVKSGWNILVGSNESKIMSAIKKRPAVKSPPHAGHRNASVSQKIVNILLSK